MQITKIDYQYYLSSSKAWVIWDLKKLKVGLMFEILIIKKASRALRASVCVCVRARVAVWEYQKTEDLVKIRLWTFCVINSSIDDYIEITCGLLLLYKQVHDKIKMSCSLHRRREHGKAQSAKVHFIVVMETNLTSFLSNSTSICSYFLTRLCFSPASPTLHSPIELDRLGYYELSIFFFVFLFSA